MLKSKPILILILLVILLLVTTCGPSGEITTTISALSFLWNAVTTDLVGNNLSVDGYIIHYGPSASDLSGSIDLGNAIEIHFMDYIDLIPPETRCFAVSAYKINASSIKVEGAYSDTFCV